ncbi:hypothetical protein ACTFIY_001719 [Dictyostelium cf. discoideum]
MAIYSSSISTKTFINTTKLKGFIYKTTGGKNNWLHEKTTTNNKTTNKITPIIPTNMKKDHEINIDNNQVRFHKPYFEWCYKAINYDLSRPFAYRNLIALIFQQIWIWICNQIFNDEKSQNETLDYNIILEKWYKSSTLDYINKIKNFKLQATKDSLQVCNTNTYIKKIIDIKIEIANDYCITRKILPNIVIVDQFI